MYIVQYTSMYYNHNITLSYVLDYHTLIDKHTTLFKMHKMESMWKIH